MIKKKIELPQLLTIQQVAKMLNVHSETLRRWDRQGRLKAIRIGKRKDRRYRKEDIDDLMT